MDRGWGAVAHNTIEYSDVALTDAAGHHLRELVTPKPYWGDVKSAHWAPNGKQLVVEEDDSGWKSSGPGKGHKALFVVDPNGTDLRQLTPWSLDAGDADWAPDGSAILFRSEPNDNDDGPGGNLYTIHPDGTDMQQLTRYMGGTLVLSSSYSPDGKEIVFSKSGVAGAPDIFVMNADGTNVQPVTHTSVWESQPDWGPAAH
jgi:Tol biopolymer transport system component